jgi:hypothetical protein
MHEARESEGRLHDQMKVRDKLCPRVLRSTLVDILAEAIETVAGCAITTDPALQRRRTAAAASRAMSQQEFAAKEYRLC